MNSYSLKTASIECLPDARKPKCKTAQVEEIKSIKRETASALLAHSAAIHVHEHTHSLDVVGLLVVLPVLVQLVDLAGHVALLRQVEAFVHFAEAALAEQTQQQVAVVERGVTVEPATKKNRL